MQPWTYRCMDCGLDIVEFGSTPGQKINSAICRECTRAAVVGEKWMPTICEPCLERTRRQVPAIHFVGRTAMCSSCFRGGEPGANVPVVETIEPKKEEVMGEKPIDWEKVKAEFAAGVKVSELAKKYEVPYGTVFYKVKQKATGAKPKSAAKPLRAHSNGNYAGAIAELEAKRDKITVAIEALKGL